MHNIGRVISVSYNNLVFEVSDFSKMNYNLHGNTYIAKGVVDYVTIVNDIEQKFIYQVIKAEDKEQQLSKLENSKIDYLGKFDCIPIGIINDGKIEFNMKSYPTLQNKVYLTSEEEYKTLFSIDASDKSLSLGLIEEKYSAQIDLSRIFNHHTAILGNTGSGKSTTIRQIISETQKFKTSNLHVHVLDVHDEYSLVSNTESIDVFKDYKINIQSLDLQDWMNLVKPSDLVQLPILQTALKLSYALKNNRISETWLRCYLGLTLYSYVQTDAVARRTKIINCLKGTGIDTSKYSAQYANFTGQAEATFLDSINRLMESEYPGETEYSFIHEQLTESEYRTDSFNNLLHGLEFAFLLEESKGNAQARSHCGTLETRIKSIQTRYDSLLSSGSDFTPVSQEQITIYSVSALDDDLLLFFSSYLLKLIFEKNKNLSLKERDVNIFILEEAHRYISKSRENSSFQEIELFKKIAREGRKFGCFIFLSSQRPSELSSTVLSQCNNYLIHRIKNNLDLDYMLRTIPYINSNQLTRISYLPTGTAFIVGELFPIPVEVNVFDNTLDNVSTTPEILFDEKVLKSIEI